MNAAERSAPQRARPCAGGGSRASATRRTRTRTCAGTPAARGCARSRSLDQRRVAAVLARQEPVAGALEDGQRARTCWAISGTNCTALAPVPIDRHALARERVVVVPCGGVEAVAGERRRRPRSRGMRGLVQLAGREDRARRPRRRRPSAVATVQRQRVVVPRARGDGRLPVSISRVDAVVARDVVQVVVDLRPAASTAATSRAAGRRRTSRGGWARRRRRPGSCCRTRCRRGRAPARGSCTSVDPVAAQLDRGGDPAEAGADDQHLEARAARTVLLVCALRRPTSAPPRRYAAAAVNLRRFARRCCAPASGAAASVAPAIRRRRQLRAGRCGAPASDSW